MKNKRGKIVSKKQNANGKRAYKNVENWVKAFMQARKILHVQGFHTINGGSLQGKALYFKAKVDEGLHAGAEGSACSRFSSHQWWKFAGKGPVFQGESGRRPSCRRGRFCMFKVFIPSMVEVCRERPCISRRKWTKAFMQARKVLHVQGFHPINGGSLQGKALYFKA